MLFGKSIMTYIIMSLLRAAYEVFQLHTSSVQLQQKIEPLRESNSGPIGLESSAVTARPGLFPFGCLIHFKRIGISLTKE